MCGIAGVLGTDEKPATMQDLRAMCTAIIHRGPDDEGFYLNGKVGLGMRRLSIIDLSTGHQPVRNEDGTIWVVFNGEIYNFRELRQDLEARGHTFYTATDTEVIVHLYEEYGDDFVSRLRGMFGFAIWDDKRKKLLLARDQVGVKPLFYGTVNGRFVFASELKSILQLPDVKKDLNWSAVNHLFAFLSTSATESIIEGIHKLEPGYMVVAMPGRPAQVSRYWDVNFEADYSKPESYYVDGLRGLLEESVRLCMISDVPLGAFLSGGVDSSAVVATMARLSPNPVKTFSIGFPEKEYNELEHAKQVSDMYGTEHHELVLEPDILSIIEDMTWHLDEPFGDSSAIPTYMVSKLASQHVKVVLSGDGGDELFAGYDKYLVEGKERNRNRYIPALGRTLLGKIGNLMPYGMKGRNFLRHNALNGVERYIDAQTMFGRDQQQKLLTKEISEQALKTELWREIAAGLTKPDLHWLSSIQYLDFKNYLPLDILTKVDRMSMAHSIEARVPLLDHKLVEFAATIPPELKIRNGRTKDIFKRALHGVVPENLLNRRKQGFGVPLAKWFRGQLTDFVRDLLLSETSRSRGIFNMDYIERILAMHDKGRDLDLHIWTLISFELWCRTFLDNDGYQKTVNISSLPPVRVYSNENLNGQIYATGM